MIKAEVNLGRAHIEASGAAGDITADVLGIVGAVYKSLPDPVDRFAYRLTVMEMVMGEEVWNMPDGEGVSMHIPKQFLKKEAEGPC